MKESFKVYHAKRPEIYEEFKKVAYQLILRGYRKLSSQLICEVIRYNSMIEKIGDYKINNDAAAGYSRLFEKEHPHYEGFFLKRLSNAEV
jgi:hypothetical protein